MVKDADLCLILADAAAPASAEGLGAPVLAVATATTSAPAEPDVPLPVVDPATIATILYTSGTTGRPKGVPQSHALVMRKYARAQQVVQILADDHVATFATVAVGQGVTVLALTWLSGATLCPFDIPHHGVARLTEWLSDRRLTVWFSSATMLRSLMQTLGDRRFPHMRVIRIGGERVLASDIVSAHRHFPAARVFVNFATTETGPITIHIAERGAVDAVVPVGRPLDGITVHLLDDNGGEVPAGEEGEIVVESADISDGYWRESALRASAFTAVPGSATERFYRTGDLGRWRADGQLEHLGRKDLRVKIRGFRIEIEEVETVLGQQVDVVRAAVAAKPGPDGNPRLVGYVQLVPESQITVERLRAQLGLRLNEYMIPSVFVIMDELPVGPTGKIARQQLPDPPPDRPMLATTYVAPRNALETTIAAVWREILGLETVGIHDAFLSIGGDSLKATLVASRLAAKLGISVPATLLFEHATIAEVSAAIEDSPATSPSG
jgi:acyl-coenzyme A synthetase/AMP-(fatty) acid ligase